MEWIIVAVPFCCLSAFAAVGFGLVIVLILRGSQPHSAEETARAETSASAFFSRTVPTLLPWQPDAASLADLSCQWQGTRSGFVVGQYMGLVKSLSQPGRPGLLAYYLSLKGRRGFLRLRTSEREVRLEIEANQARASVGEQRLGSINLREGTIFDGGGQPIGRYHRYRGLRWQVGSRPVGSRYGSVELRGRTLAEVNDALVRGSGLFDSGAASRPLVRSPSAPSTPLGAGPVADLTPEEENWLLALVAVELYHSALRSRTRQRSV